MVKMRRIPHAAPALLWALVFSPLADGADTPQARTEQPQVVIEATQTNLTKLGQEVLQLEYRFYQRYNDLNTVRKYAVDCANEAQTGWRMKRMQCMPRFQSEAQMEEAREFMLAMGAGSNPSGGGPARPTNPFAAPPPVSPGSTTAATSAIEAGRPGFKQNMSEVVSRNPELQKMLHDHAAAWKNYEDVFRRLNGRSPVPAKKDVDAAAPPPASATPAGAQ